VRASAEAGVPVSGRFPRVSFADFARCVVYLTEIPNQHLYLPPFISGSQDHVDSRNR